jgi:RimJ/RimL family protein N-acetyltransferase
MNHNICEEISTWQYPPEYQFHDFFINDYKEILAGHYYASICGNELIGFVKVFRDVQFPADSSTIDLQFAINPKLIGRNFGNKFFKRIYEYVHRTLGWYRIRVCIHKENIPAIKVAVNNGFKRLQLKNDKVVYLNG